MGVSAAPRTCSVRALLVTASSVMGVLESADQLKMTARVAAEKQEATAAYAVMPTLRPELTSITGGASTVTVGMGKVLRLTVKSFGVEVKPKKLETVSRKVKVHASMSSSGEKITRSTLPRPTSFGWMVRKLSLTAGSMRHSYMSGLMPPPLEREPSSTRLVPSKQLEIIEGAKMIADGGAHASRSFVATSSHGKTASFVTAWATAQYDVSSSHVPFHTCGHSTLGRTPTLMPTVALVNMVRYATRVSGSSHEQMTVETPLPVSFAVVSSSRTLEHGPSPIMPAMLVFAPSKRTTIRVPSPVKWTPHKMGGARPI